MRSKRDFVYRIDKIPKPRKIFKLIQEKSDLSAFQMNSDFNMGIGYAIFVPERDVQKVLDISKTLNFDALKAGRVESGKRKVIIEPLGIILEGRDLKIR